jgi:hypothetical protein
MGLIIKMSEGLGSYKGTGMNDKHPKGRLGAKLEVFKDGKLIFETKKASTLPDDPGGNGEKFNDGLAIPTVCVGEYNLYSTRHKGRPAAELEQGSNTIPVIRKDYKSKSAYINLHHRWINDNNTFAWSCGCLTVLEQDFKNMLEAVGITKNGRYQGSGHLIGKIIIDRSYISEDLIKLYKGIYGKAFFDVFNVKESIQKTAPKISSWAKDSWEKAKENGINDGKGAKNNVTEEQLMVFFDRLEEHLVKKYNLEKLL